MIFFVVNRPVGNNKLICKSTSFAAQYLPLKQLRFRCTGWRFIRIDLPIYNG